MAARPIRDLWRAEVIRSTAITDGTKLLLVVMADDMREDGYVSVPREVLAKRLGRNERKVSARLEAAVTARLLDRVVRGNRGRTAVYRALLPDVQSLPVLSTLPPAKPAGSKHPIEVENRHPLGANSGTPGGPTTTKSRRTSRAAEAAAVLGLHSELPSENEEVPTQRRAETDEARALLRRACESWGMEVPAELQEPGAA
jgi:hypothetical protein